MGKKRPKKRKRFAKCPWCSRQVEVYKGRLRSHLWGAKRCVGVGQPEKAVKDLQELQEAARRAKGEAGTG